MIPLLMILLAAQPAGATLKQRVEFLPPRDELTYDWAVARERTRQFEAAQARHQAAERNVYGAANSNQAAGLDYCVTPH